MYPYDESERREGAKGLGSAGERGKQLDDGLDFIRPRIGDRLALRITIDDEGVDVIGGETGLLESMLLMGALARGEAVYRRIRHVQRGIEDGRADRRRLFVR